MEPERRPPEQRPDHPRQHRDQRRAPWYRTKSQPSFDDMRMIMVTTEAELPRMMEALEAGANEYLMKPFTKEALHDKLVLVGLTG